MSILGLDVGTTSTKLIVVSDAGEIVKTYRHSYSIQRDEVSSAILKASDINEAIHTCFIQAYEIMKTDPPKALSISVIGEALMVQNNHLGDVSDLILPMDYRGESEYLRFAKKFEEKKLIQRTGIMVHPQSSLSKILWLTKKNKNAKFIDLQTYLIFLLTGEFVTEHSMASRTQYYNLLEMGWDSEILVGTGISEQNLVKIIPTGTDVGSVLTSVSKQFGIPKACRVIIGGFDQTCSSLGAGMHREGIATDNIGTTLSIASLESEYNAGCDFISKGYFWSRYVNNKMFYINGGTQAGGIVLEWVANLLRLPTTDVGELLDNLEDISPKSILLPFFTGSGTPTPNSLLKASLSNLDFNVTQMDIFTSALDSINFEARMIFDSMMEKIGHIDKIIISGSVIRSNAWLKRKAMLYSDIDLYKSKISETSALGAAMIAATGIGMFDSLSEASQQWSDNEVVHNPESPISTEMVDRFEKYRELR